MCKYDTSFHLNCTTSEGVIRHASIIHQLNVPFNHCYGLHALIVAISVSIAETPWNSLFCFMSPTWLHLLVSSSHARISSVSVHPLGWWLHVWHRTEIQVNNARTSIGSCTLFHWYSNIELFSFNLCVTNVWLPELGLLFLELLSQLKMYLGP